jgi:alanine racemase
MAVVKANGYGHGLLRVAEALNEAEGFALLDIQDAVDLREAGFCQTILLLEGCFTPDDLSLCAEYELTTVIHNLQQIAMLDAFPRRGKLNVWLKVNSGMNRLGFASQEIAAVMERLKSHVAVREVTLMTHFSHADEAQGVSAQLELFQQITSAYRVPCSLANSAALLRYPATHGDWVRPGIMLYGASPFVDATAHTLGLRPAMTLTSQIISVQEMKTGDHVGYAGTYRTDRPIRIGTVACGYADGYPRHAPSGSPILVNGKQTRTLGRVSMDMLSVDLSMLPEAEIGNPVTLWGAGLPVEEVAHAAATISYELLCALAMRVPVVS